MISIIMPVYNSGSLLEQSIGSVLNQEYREWELIIVDDGSTDNSLEICNELSKDSRIHVYSINNSGPSVARNTALSYAKGDFIMFLDSDDMLANNALNIVSEIINNNEAELIIFNYFNDIYDGITVNHNFVREINSGLYKSNNEFKENYLELDNEFMTFPIWNKVYSQNLIKRANASFPTNTSVAEDLQFNLSIYKETKSVKVINNKLYHYILHPQGSLSLNVDLDRLKKYKEVYKKSIQFFDNWLPPVVNNMKNNYVYEINLYINNLYNKDTILSKNARKELVKQIVDDKDVRECISDIIPNNTRTKIICSLLKKRRVHLLMLAGWLSRVGK